MEADIAQGPIGTHGQWELDFKSGALVAKAQASKSELGLSIAAEVKLEAGAVIDALARAIPGTVDDALLGVLKAALASK